MDDIALLECLVNRLEELPRNKRAYELVTGPVMAGQLLNALENHGIEVLRAGSIPGITRWIIQTPDGGYFAMRQRKGLPRGTFILQPL